MRVRVLIREGSPSPERRYGTRNTYLDFWNDHKMYVQISETKMQLETVSIAEPLQNRQHAQNP